MALITDHIDEDTSVSEIEETVSFSNEQLLNRIKHLESENKGLLDLNAQQEQDLQNVRDKLESKEDTAVIKNLKKLLKDKDGATADPAGSPAPPPKPKQKVPVCYEELRPKEKTDNICDPISDELCEILTHCWHEPIPKADIVEAIKAAERPRNATMLKPLQINEQVHQRMEKPDKSKEQPMRYLGNVVCAAGKHLARLMDMLAKAEITCREEDPEADGWLSLENMTFDFPLANTLMKDAMKLLGIANVQTGQYRRELLTSKFKDTHAKLCDNNQPFTGGKFFGENFDASTALITGENKVINEALKVKQNYNFGNNFRGKSRGFAWKKRSSPYTAELKKQNNMLRQMVASQSGQQHFLGMANNPGHPLPQQWYGPQQHHNPSPSFTPNRGGRGFNRGRGRGRGRR